MKISPPVIPIVATALLICLLLLPLSVQAEDTFKVTGSVDQTEVFLFDRIEYSIVVEGSTRNIPEAKMGEFKGVKIAEQPRTSSHFNYINGKVTSRKITIYVLQAREEGDWILPAAEIRVGGKVYRSKPIPVSVQKPKTIAQTGADTGITSGIPRNKLSDIFLWMSLDKTEPFVGEPVKVTYNVYTRLQVSDFGVSDSPDYSGFWVEEIPGTGSPSAREVHLHGIKYLEARVHEIMLYPTVSGDLAIEPLSMIFEVESRKGDSSGRGNRSAFPSFFNQRRRERCTSQAGIIYVQALPVSGKPAGFSGAVGEFEIETSLKSKSGKVGEAVEVALLLSGTHGLATLPPPLFPDHPDFKMFEPKADEVTHHPKRPSWKQRRFEYILVPHTSGDFEIPAVTYSIFDPKSKQYRTIKSDPLKVHIDAAPGSGQSGQYIQPETGDITLLSHDIRYIKSNVKIINRVPPYKQFRFIFGFLAPLILAPFILLYGKHYHRMHGDMGYARAFKARSQSQKQFAKAQNLLDKNEFNGAVDTGAGAFLKYLGNRLNLPPGGMTLTDVSDALKSRQVTEDLISKIQKYWEDLEIARYAPGSLDRTQTADLIHRGQELVENLERIKLKRKPKKQKPTVAVFMIVILLTGFTAGASADESFQALFDRANRHYETGDFSAARTLYQSLVNQGCVNDRVFYNLGNCWFKENDLGRAITNYLRAERLSPRDTDIQANLQLARTLVKQKIESEPPGFANALFSRLHRNMTLTEISVLTLLLYLMTVALFLLSKMVMHRRQRRKFLRLAIVCLVLWGIASISLGERIYDLEFRVRAVAVGSEIIARNGPGEHFTEVYTQQPGYEMIIKRQQSDWIEAVLPNGYTGWAPKSAVEFL